MNLSQRVVRPQGHAPVYAGSPNATRPKNPELVYCLRLVEIALASLRAPATVSTVTIDHMLISFAANLGVRRVLRWSWHGWYQEKIRADHLIPLQAVGVFRNCIPRLKTIEITYAKREFSVRRDGRQALSPLRAADRLVLQDLDGRRLQTQERVLAMCWPEASADSFLSGAGDLKVFTGEGVGAKAHERNGRGDASNAFGTPVAEDDAPTEEYLVCRPMPEGWRSDPRFEKRKRLLTRSSKEAVASFPPKEPMKLSVRFELPLEVDRRFLAREKSSQARGGGDKFIVVRGGDPVEAVSAEKQRQRDQLLELQRAVDAKHWSRIQKKAEA